MRNLPLFLLIITAAVLAGLKYDTHRREQRAHWSTHRIIVDRYDSVFFTIEGPGSAGLLGRPKTVSGNCSATAIGPHALLTATHCESVFPDIKVDGHPAHVDRIVYDTADHSIYFLSGISFSHWASVSSAPPEQGDEVYIFGNPRRHWDYLRRGYVVSVDNNGDYGTLSTLDINGFFGDSGAAVFNQHGEIASVISKIMVDGDDSGATMKTMWAFDLCFRKEQYAEAAKY